MDKRVLPEYSAKTAYLEYEQAQQYEAIRFAGRLGRYRREREARNVGRLVRQLAPGSVVLDCPSGTGRWWPLLSERASRIIAVDLSDAMLRFGRERAAMIPVEVDFVQADATALPLEDRSVDVTFSHALTKHLPIPVQYQVLREFGRVSRTAVICSFGIFSHVSYEIWRRRKLSESYPVFREELEWMSRFAGLEVRERRRVTTPVGVEHSVLFTKV